MRQVAIYRKQHLKVGDILTQIYHPDGRAKVGEEVWIKNFLTGKEYFGRVIHADNLHYAVQIQRKPRRTK